MTKEMNLVARTTRYPMDAFVFVQMGLDFTVRRIHGEPPPAGRGHSPGRHVSGQDLCRGLRDYAIEQYGLLARTVLRRWNINACEDFGQIVYAMVAAGMMHKTENDTIRDFYGVFDFATAFTPQLETVQMA